MTYWTEEVREDRSKSEKTIIEPIRGPSTKYHIGKASTEDCIRGTGTKAKIRAPSTTERIRGPSTKQSD